MGRNSYKWKFFAFISNKILSNGEDKIIFYNLSSKNIVKIIKNYSFNLSQNTLCLIFKENESNNKLLLCSSKKYLKCQKNGILLLKIQLKNDFSISKSFYETNKFEVYCFIQIFISNENSVLKKKQLIGTEFLLVGGFDTDKLKGLIKLYKINYNKDNFDLTNIEYIHDNEIKKDKKYKGFKGPIICITQSKYNGNILWHVMMEMYIYFLFQI